MRKSLLALVLALSANLLSAAEPPNIVFIFSDDHSPNAIGAYNRWLKSVNPTPHIDQLAAQGMVFERSYCTNSICGPVRAVIETGKHSHRNGFRQNERDGKTNGNGNGLKKTRPMLAPCIKS